MPIRPQDLVIGAKYYDTRLHVVGRACTYPPPADPFTTLDVTGKGQFGGGTVSSELGDLVPCRPAPADREGLEAWLDE